MVAVWLSSLSKVMWSLVERTQATCISEKRGVFRTSGSSLENGGFMEAAFLPRTVMLLPAIRHARGRRLIQQNVVVWIGRIGTGWSAGTWAAATPDKLTSVAEPVQ